VWNALFGLLFWLLGCSILKSWHPFCRWSIPKKLPRDHYYHPERLRSPSRRLRRVMVERLVRIIILAVRLFHRSQVRAENALFPHHPPASLGIIIIIANVSVHPRAACGA